MAKFLLQNGMNANLRDKNELSLGWTPLMHAARWGHEAIVKLCLENGAEINAGYGDGMTSLDIAALVGRTTVVKLLLKRGAEVDLRMESPHNTLFQAIFGGDAAVVAVLLDQGVCSQTETTKTNHLFIQAVKVTISTEHLSVLKLLLTKSDVIDGEDGEGRTPLFWAIDSQREKMISLLLDCGANIESKDKYCWTPLMYAIVQGAYLPVVKILLDRGADINAEDDEGQTPLSVIKRNPTLTDQLETYIPGLKIDR